MGIIGALILGIVAAAIIGVCQENDHALKKKNKNK